MTPATNRRTISSEIVTAFIDALINDIRVGVGARGSKPEALINSIRILKGFLEANNLSLGSIAWDSVITRLLESGGFNPEQRPEIFLRLFNLAAEFGTEIGSANASPAADDEVPYFFEPTAAPLGLLHRAMRAFINIGDTKRTLESYNMLQQHTDINKQKSLEQFFETLKSTPRTRAEPFERRQSIFRLLRPICLFRCSADCWILQQILRCTSSDAGSSTLKILMVR